MVGMVTSRLAVRVEPRLLNAYDVPISWVCAVQDMIRGYLGLVGVLLPDTEPVLLAGGSVHGGFEGEFWNVSWRVVWRLSSEVDRW